MKCLIDRLQTSLSSLNKKLVDLVRHVLKQDHTTIRPEAHGISEPNSSSNLCNDYRGQISDYQKFIGWYLTFINTELQPSSSYQARITSLSVLIFLVQAGLSGSTSPIVSSKPRHTDTVSLNYSAYCTSLNRTIIDLLMDPFEDLRDRAGLVLQMTSFSSSHLTINSDIGSLSYSQYSSLLRGYLGSEDSSNGNDGIFLKRAYTLMNQTGRADHADGFARSVETIFIHECKKQLTSSMESSQGLAIVVEVFVSVLVEKLEALTHCSTSTEEEAVSSTSVHGFLAALRLVFKGKCLS